MLLKKSYYVRDYSFSYCTSKFNNTRIFEFSNKRIKGNSVCTNQTAFSSQNSSLIMNNLKFQFFIFSYCKIEIY